MSRTRKVAPALAVGAALVTVAVIVGFFVTRGSAGSTSSSSTSASTTSAAAGSESAGGAAAAPTTSVVETDAAAPAANPSSGQAVATDEPAAVDGAQVSVELTSWGWNASQRSAQVRGYAAGVVEDGGTCTLTLSKGTEQVTAEIEALPDASTTACGSVDVRGDQLSPGTWQAVLGYDSATSSGSSAPVQIEVPR
jgi:hypothetical protein